MPNHGEPHPPETKIIVDGRRDDDDDGGGGGGGTYVGGGDIFVFYPSPGGGGGGGRANTPPPPPPPAVEEGDDQEAEYIVNGPSKGQEHFADDGNPFNDGEAPTGQTVDAWLEGLLASGVTREIVVKFFHGEPDVFTGSYTDNGGNKVTFGSDGADNYYLFTVPPASGGPGGDTLSFDDLRDMIRLPNNNLDYDYF